MSLVTGALQIGRSALLAYQSALQVVGNNISNAGSDSYVRQTAVLTPITGITLPEGYAPGGGVALTGLRRNVDETLENRLRMALGDQAAVLAEQQTLGRIESILNELSDSDLSTLLQNFFNAWSNLQNSPEEESTRQMVLVAGETLANEIQRQRQDALGLRDELNTQIEDSTHRANTLADDIAALNVQITALENSSVGGANALRDQRDALLRELSTLVQIQVREQPDGGVNVYIGNEPLVQGGLNRGLTTTLETVEQDPKAVVRFADNHGMVSLTGGQIAGLITARDEHVSGFVDDLNSLAQALISEVNKVHAGGSGLKGYSEVLGTFDVLNSVAALNSADAGLDLVPNNGSFLIKVLDTSTGMSVVTTITVDLDGIGTDESLESLAAKLNAVGNVTALATSDNRLRITADNGFEVYFAEDTSNVLAALGINTFFSGRDGSDIGVNSILTATGGARLLAAGQGGGPGDGSNAAAMANLGTDSLSGLGGQSLNDFYNTIATRIAVKGSAAMAAVDAADAITMGLTSQRESVSGVNLDEETISLMRLQRSFQGAARYATTVNELLEELLGLLG